MSNTHAQIRRFAPKTHACLLIIQGLKMAK